MKQSVSDQNFRKMDSTKFDFEKAISGMIYWCQKPWFLFSRQSECLRKLKKLLNDIVNLFF